MKYGIPEAFDRPVFRYELEHIQYGTASLYGKSSGNYVLHYSDDAPGALRAVSFLKHHPFFQCDLFSKKKEKNCSAGNYAESSNLNQQKQDDFSEKSKLGSRRDGYKSCYAYGSDRSEQGV